MGIPDYEDHLAETAFQQVVYHTGSSTSFRNVFYRIPSRGHSLILLTNRNQPAEVDIVALAEQIMEVANR